MRNALLFAALLLTQALLAQAPANDDCSGIIDLGTAPICPPTVFSNMNATAFDIGAFNAPPCLSGGAPTHDVWFAFTCPDTLFDFRITLTATGGQPIRNPQLMLYRGTCAPNGLALLRCDEDKTGSGKATFDIDGLSGGLRYFLRVSDYTPAGNPPNWGQFILCIDRIPTVVTIDQGSSSLCSGTLYDSGGPDGDYGADENFTFTICPDQPNVQCIEFNLEYFYLEQAIIFGFGDYLTFYDGSNVNAPQIGQIGGSLFSEENTGGGGVCYSVQATSGCLTLQFTSDFINEYEGWKGSWTCSSAPCQQAPALSVDNTITPPDIEAVLNTPFNPVTITSIKCPSGAYGTFSLPTTSNLIGMDKGLLLTSGSVFNAIGPNDATDTDTDNGAVGDPDLDYLSGILGAPSQDACVIELDVVATTNELTFEYAFGSEEYPEFANDVFNDIFAFLISGPGIVGDPGLGGAKNIAVIPGTSTAVEINTINPIINWAYYRPQPIAGPTLEYDGFAVDSFAKKKTLTARASVIPCNTYHLKLAIADRFDGLYDSGVFISEIKGGSPSMATQFEGDLPYLTENCSPPNQIITISIPDPLPDPLKYYLQVSGTATRNADYVSNLPDSITFSPGQTALQFDISSLSDNLTEDAETIVLTLSNDFGCGTVVFDTLTILLRDQLEVNITAGDTLRVCSGTSPQVEATGALEYFWTPPGAVNDPFIANPIVVNATQSFYLRVEGTLGTCTDTDSIWISVLDPQIEVVRPTDSTLCAGETLSLIALTNVPDADVMWSPSSGVANPNSLTTTATLSESTYYVATLTFGNCTVSDSIHVLVDEFEFPTLANDTVICQGNAVRLATPVPTSTTQYQWLPTLGVSDPFAPNPIATPNQTTTYTLTATSENGYCTKQGTTTITVLPSDVDILGPDSIKICLGTPVSLTAEGTPAGAATVQWSPTFYVNPDSGPTTTATPDESVTIYATYDVGGCISRDSVHIRVDSLPQSKIFLKPVKPIYCPGDTVILFSNTYEPANFPDIMHEWQPFGGQETATDLWNMVITATMTHTFVRITTNNACSVVDTVHVPVGEIPVVTITASPNNICAGTEVQLMATVTPDQKLMWQPNPLLSCTECTDPKVSPTMTTVFEVTTPEATCPGGASITVTVIPPPPLNLAPSQSICLGDSILLNNVPPQPGATYVWQASTGLPPVGVNPKVAPDVPTTYTVTAIGTCVNTGSVTITPVTASITASPDVSLCYGETTTLTATLTGQPGTVRWEPGTLIGNPVNVTPDSTTLYTVTLSYGPGCTATDQVLVSVNPAKLELKTPPDPTVICAGSPIALNLAPPEPNVTYTWTASAGPAPTGPNPTVTPSATTTYTITAVSGQCTKTAQTTIQVANATVNASADQTICFGQTVPLTAVATGTAGTFSWTPGNFQGNPFQVTPLQTTAYTVTYAYGPGCTATDAVNVTVQPGISLTNLTGDPSPAEGVCEGSPVKLRVSVLPAGTPLTWSQNGVVIPGITADSITVKPVGDKATTVYTVTASTTSGCTGTATIAYESTRCFEVPNAFTPNGDQVNGTFGIVQYGGELTVEYMAVYNRWGQKVFETTRPNQRWDGRFEDKDAPADVYAYTLRVRFPNGDVVEQEGDVTLLR